MLPDVVNRRENPSKLVHIRNHKVTVYYIVICIFTVTIPLPNLTSRIEYIAHASFSQTYAAIQRKGAGVLAVRRLQSAAPGFARVPGVLQTPVKSS